MKNFSLFALIFNVIVLIIVLSLFLTYYLLKPVSGSSLQIFTPDPEEYVSIHKYNMTKNHLHYQVVTKAIADKCILDVMLTGKLDTAYMKKFRGYIVPPDYDELHIKRSLKSLNYVTPDDIDSIYDAYLESITFMYMQPGEDSAMYKNTDTYRLFEKFRKH